MPRPRVHTGCHSQQTDLSKGRGSVRAIPADVFWPVVPAGHVAASREGGVDRLGQLVWRKGFDQDAVDAAVDRLADNLPGAVARDQDDLERAVQRAGTPDDLEAVDAGHLKIGRASC